jgi:hypothetical protein
MNSSGTYTRTSIDNSLALKANLATTYSMTQVDTALALKANTGVSYTIAQSDTNLLAKQATLTSASNITVNTFNCNTISVNSLTSAFTCLGDASFSTGTFSGNLNALRFVSGGSARFYHYSYGAYSGAVISHNYGLQFAVSSVIPPLTADTFMTMDVATGITISKFTDHRAGLTVSSGDFTTYGNTFNNGSYYNPVVGSAFYTPNMATPSVWDARIKLGHATQDGLLLYGGAYGIKLYQCPTDGGALITLFNSVDKRLRHYGNISTETGGTMTSSSFVTISDERVKTNIVNADITECERLVKTVSPKGYERTDYTSGRKLGYIAQDWHSEITGDFNSAIISYDDSDNNRTLYALDMLPIVSIIHGALKSALNKIELLEARVSVLEGSA